MTMGWGTVPLSDWDGIKTSPGQDKVPPGDYEVVPKMLRHMEPSEKSVLGLYVVQLETTPTGNADEWKGKQLDFRMNYHPAPSTDGYRKMNEISLQNAKSLLMAANVMPFEENGMIDIPKSLEMMCASAPRIVVAVSHRKDGDREYQDVGNPRPSV